MRLDPNSRILPLGGLADETVLRLLGVKSGDGLLQLQLQLQQQLMQQLEPPPNIVFILNQYQLPILVYLKSVYLLELLKVQRKKQGTFHILFDYLEDKAVQKDRQGMYDCVCTIVEKLFMASSPSPPPGSWTRITTPRH